MAGPPARFARMARKPRLNVPGGVYHVLARGNRLATIFHDDADYRAYFERLERYRQRDGVNVHAYVVMSNHVHLLLETGNRPLARTMHTLQFTFSQYYNRRYQKSGHVFQGRYHAILCDRAAYLLELVRYLHLNPARRRTPLSPWTYPWSSHAAYLGRLSPVVVTTSSVLESLHCQVGQARQAYRRFLMDGLSQGHQERFYEAVDQQVLGDERFIEPVTRQIAPRHALSARPPRVAFGPLVRAVATVHHMTPRAILAPGRHRAPVSARAMLVCLAREWGALSTGELGRRLRRDPSMVSRLATTYAAQRNSAVEARVRQILDPMTSQQLNTHA